MHFQSLPQLILTTHDSTKNISILIKSRLSHWLCLESIPPCCLPSSARLCQHIRYSVRGQITRGILMEQLLFFLDTLSHSNGRCKAGTSELQFVQFGKAELICSSPIIDATLTVSMPLGSAPVFFSVDSNSIPYISARVLYYPTTQSSRLDARLQYCPGSRCRYEDPLVQLRRTTASET